MGFVQAFRSLLTRIARNIIAVVNRLSEHEVLVTHDGDIVVREPAVKWLSDKLSAFVLGAAALLFLFSPLQGTKAMAIGDQLLRAAMILWAGGETAST